MYLAEVIIKDLLALKACYDGEQEQDLPNKTDLTQVFSSAQTRINWICALVSVAGAVLLFG